MLLVTAEEMREIDRQTIDEVGIPGVVLMENAGAQVAKEVMELAEKNKKVVVLAGHGNNGGDGFVIARRLGNIGYDVETWFFGKVDRFSEETQIHFHALVHTGYKVKIWNEDNHSILTEQLNKADVIIDALLGTGIVGELREPVKSIITLANQSKAKRVAVDMPTGVNTNTGEVVDTAFRADYTITFALPKIGQYLYPGAEYTGTLKVVDISIPPNIIQKVRSGIQIITKESVTGMLSERKPNTHKGTYGHALIIGGSKDMPGAPTLSTLASLRTGAGLTTAVIPESIQPMIFSRLPEAICKGVPETPTGHFSLRSVDLMKLDEDKYTAVGLGPGLGVWAQGRDWLLKVLKSVKRPLVIDADGLNLLSEDLSPLSEREETTILTPHPGEMARLVKKTTKYVEQNRISLSKELAITYGIYVILKGAHTIIACPNGQVFLNITGGPELAKGGTGDILTGMLVGLLAQRIPVEEAIKLAVYLHGLAGSLASSPSNYSTIATEVIDKIGFAIHQTMSYHANHI